MPALESLARLDLSLARDAFAFTSHLPMFASLRISLFNYVYVFVEYENRCWRENTFYFRVCESGITRRPIKIPQSLKVSTTS